MKKIGTSIVLGISIAAAAVLAVRGESGGAGSAGRPIATIQDIMTSLVDPPADALWAAVSSSSSAAGEVINEPRSEEEWKAARRNAVALVEAPNLLIMEGRKVARPGSSLEDANVAGILPAGDIQKKIDGDPQSFVERARALQEAGKAALAAIDARDAKLLFEAGDRLDKACEECHIRYWYPNDKRPPVPSNPNLAPK